MGLLMGRWVIESKDVEFGFLSGRLFFPDQFE
jgi:hypothetical protein